MEPPTFAYRTTPSSRTAGQQPMHESDTLAPTRPIESASASTVPQTNSSNFAYVLTGVALGIVFGALPGLTAVMGVALLIPLTFGFPAVIAFSALLGMYCGAIYAGSITAILVGTPGTAARRGHA